MSVSEFHSAFRPFASLHEAATAMLPLLGEAVDLSLWMITKKEGEDWVPIAIHDLHYGLQRGMRFPWCDSLCAAMVNGEGPMLASNAGHVPAYAGAGAMRQWQIGTYVGCPLFDRDGRLFGTLCGIDPQPRELDETRILPRLILVARSLATFMALQGQIDKQLHRAECAEREARIDHMTGILNRRGWELALHEEQQRLQRTDGSVGVLYADLDSLKSINDEFGHDAGDALIRRCALVLQEQARPYDSVARIGGDEFALLLSGAHREDMEPLIARIRDAFSAARVAISLGWSWAGLGGSVAVACREADAALLAVKPMRVTS
jgi:diguanylate cyclase (GGDEF)-like protein